MTIFCYKLLEVEWHTSKKIGKEDLRTFQETNKSCLSKIIKLSFVNYGDK